MPVFAGFLILIYIAALAVLWIRPIPCPRAPGDPCATCAYRLDGLPPKGRCPECGTPYAVGEAPPARGLSWEHAVEYSISIAAALALLFFTDHVAAAYDAFFYVYTPHVRVPLLHARHGCTGTHFDYRFIIPLVIFCLIAPHFRLIAGRTLAPVVFIAGFLGAVALSFIIPIAT